MSTMTLPSNPRLAGLQSAYLPPPPSRSRTTSSVTRNINDSRNVKLPSSPSSSRGTNRNELRYQKSSGNLSSRHGIDPSLSSNRRIPPSLPNPPLPPRTPSNPSVLSSRPSFNSNSEPSMSSLRTLPNPPLPSRSQTPSLSSNSLKNPPYARSQPSPRAPLVPVTSSGDPYRGRSTSASTSKLKLENPVRSKSLNPSSSRSGSKLRTGSPDRAREFGVSLRQTPPVPSLPNSSTTKGSDSANRATEMKSTTSTTTATSERPNQAGTYYNTASEVVGNRWNAIKKAVVQGTTSSSTAGSNAKASSTSTSDASHLWDSLLIRMTTAASYVKTHLSEDVDPEEKADPQTGESHLIKVMKAHHLGKVERKEELPAWLFGEEERKGWEVGEREVDLSWGREEEREVRSRGNSESSKSSWDSGYFSSSREDSFDSKRGNSYDPEIEIGKERSRAGDKLKMMRERKRGNLIVG